MRSGIQVHFQHCKAKRTGENICMVSSQKIQIFTDTAKDRAVLDLNKPANICTM